MRLRSQMFLAVALTLVVPLVGWQSVKQLYVALQQTRIDDQMLKVANMRLALSESLNVASWLEPSLAAERPNDWYAEKSRYPLFVDGYDDDWRNLLGSWYTYDSASTDNKLSLRLAKKNQRLYLFLKVTDDHLIYHSVPKLETNPAEGETPDRWLQLVNGDSVHIAVQAGDGRVEHGLFRTVAPGSVAAVSGVDQPGRPAGSALPGWRGFWSRSVDGYQLEASIALPGNGTRVGVAVVDVDTSDEPRRRWLGTFDPLPKQTYSLPNLPKPADSAISSRVFFASELVQEQLQGWTNSGARSRLFDVHGRLVADVNNLYTTVLDDLDDEEAASFKGVLDALLFRVFSFMVADDLPLLPEQLNAAVLLNLSDERRSAVVNDQPLTTRYVTDENDRVLGTLASIGQNPLRAYLLLEANEEHASAYAGSQLARLFSLLLLVSLLVGCGLLVFAIGLSSRIRRLSGEAQRAVSVDGRVNTLFSNGLTDIDAQDEIGDLSRKLSSLLSRSAQYTQYLEALSGRLSHELRTPLSVVRTSLENLDVNALDKQSKLLIERAEGGAVQLGRIIKALVDSTRLENSVQDAALEEVELGRWLRGVCDIYSQLYPDVRFVIRPQELPELNVRVSPELLQQAMDKLVDNAVSFSHNASLVLQLSRDDTRAESHAMLAVANQGPAIDERQWSTLFDPLVSLRDIPQGSESAEDLHLGLGLYMVRLIARGVGGEVFARNQDKWVVFGVSLPLS